VIVQELGIQVIAIDGKNLRGSYDRESGSKALHLSVWATEHRLVLAQSKVQDKSNEITAIPAYELLDVKGCIVTLDAMGTQNHRGSDSAGASRLHPLLESQSSHTVPADRHLV